MKKTAIVYHFFAHYREAVVRSLAESGRRFVLVGCAEDPEGSIKQMTVPHGVEFQETRGVFLFGRVFLQSGLLRLAIRRDIDCIIYLGDASYLMTWISAALARLVGKQVLFWTHGYVRRDHGLKRILRKAFYRLAHGLLLYGNLGKALAIEQGFDSDRLHVIYNSLDYAQQAAARKGATSDAIRKRRASLFRDPDRPIVICTTRLTQVRRLDLLIEAAAVLAASGKPVNVLLVGDGPARSSLQRLSSKLGVEVCFFGECYDETVLCELLMCAAVTVAPGKVGLTAMHSLAFGVPVITHDTWDKQMPESEAVIPGKTGDFFREDDVASLAESVRKWITRAGSPGAVEAACISVIERIYNPRHQARLILRALKGYPANDLISANAIPGDDWALRRLLVVSNGVTPYGVHFLCRVADELPGWHLQTVYSTQYSMGKWPGEVPAKLNATILGRGQTSVLARSPRQLLADWRRSRQLIREMRYARPEAVMVLGYSSLAHLLAIFWCRARGVPCLMWADSNAKGDRSTGIKRLAKRFLLRQVVAKLDAVLVCGRLGSQYYASYGATPTQTFFVPNEPDYATIESAPEALLNEVASKYGIDRQRKRIVYSGRLVQEKRVDLLIRAFEGIAADRPDWDLMIVGNGPLRGILGAIVPLHLKDRVIWPGFVGDQRHIAGFYRLSSVLVLPSDYEPWALVVNEAACAGLALVCSDVVGAAYELLRDGENGRVFAAGDGAALRSALREVTDPQLLSRFQARSRQILDEWRASADPVQGLRRALESCTDGHAHQRGPILQ